jgi:hypothetical protein
MTALRAHRCALERELATTACGPALPLCRLVVRPCVLVAPPDREKKCWLQGLVLLL